MFSHKIVFVFISALLFVTGEKYFGQPLKYCLSADSNPYLYFGTKTSYDQTRSTAGSDTVCKPIQFWSLNRHGTRYASTEILQEMKNAIDLRRQILDNYSEGLAPTIGALCEADLLAISNWKWDESIETEGNNLTVEGWRELREIAERYQRRYPDLLTGYSEDQFYFRHSAEQRTWDSCRAYIEGLFGSFDGIKIEDPREDDDVLRPYNICPAWLNEVKNNDEFMEKEKRIFRQQDDYLQLLNDVSRRLGYKINLKDNDIDIMYSICSFEKSWYPEQISPWCAAFSKPELQLLEYYEDLGQFYKTGYSHEYNPKLGCLPLKYMMETFAKTVTENVPKPRVVSMFSHDTLLSLVFTTLRFGKDQTPLKGTDYADLMVNRKFRSSLNSPFAANIAVVLHKCSSGNYEVQLFLNERPMELDGCPKGLCSWEYLKNFFSVTVDCNLDFCYK